MRDHDSLDVGEFLPVHEPKDVPRHVAILIITTIEADYEPSRPDTLACLIPYRDFPLEVAEVRHVA
jgi:hypothetical protein